MQISDICGEINTNIKNVQDCVDDIISFMETDVADKFKEFVSISNEYGGRTAECGKDQLGKFPDYQRYRGEVLIIGRTIYFMSKISIERAFRCGIRSAVKSFFHKI